MTITIKDKKLIEAEVLRAKNDYKEFAFNFNLK